MTVAEKRAEAMRLRRSGKKLREISAAMGAPISTVSQWITDPTGEKLRARQDRYRGKCEECGSPTTGNLGPGRAPRKCQDCITWTREQIVDAMRRWAREHGVPPKMADWHRAQAGFPSSRTVTHRFGWNELLLEAGFDLRCDRRPETQEWIEAQLAAGRRVVDIADELGCVPHNVYQRLRSRGVATHDVRGVESEAARRERFIARWNEGAPTAEIAAEFGITRRSAVAWAVRLREGGYPVAYRRQRHRMAA